MPGASFMALAADFCGGNDAYTKILLHMDGANAGTTFTDSDAGGGAHTWTANSATTSTTQTKFGTTAASFSGTTSWIDTPDSADFTLGAGDFTIDFWFWVSGGAGAGRQALGQMDSAATAASTSVYAGLSAANVWQFNTMVSTTITTVTGTTAFTSTGWHHIAMVRASNVLKMFLDGVQEGGNIAQAGTINDSANKFSVGRAGELASSTWNGFIDEFRLSVGFARWTANFVPPAAPYA